MNAHTPGPWKALPPRMGTSWVIQPANDAPEVAYLYGSNTAAQMERARSGETEANARLIASAPDLLEALRRVSTMLPECGDPPNNDDHEAMHEWYAQRIFAMAEVARIAIAKAEGKS